MKNINYYLVEIEPVSAVGENLTVTYRSANRYSIELKNYSNDKCLEVCFFIFDVIFQI